MLELIKLDSKSVKKIVSIVARSGEWTVDLYPEATSGKVFRLSTNPKLPYRLKVGSFHGLLAIVSILEHIIGQRFHLIAILFLLVILYWQMTKACFCGSSK